MRAKAKAPIPLEKEVGKAVRGYLEVRGWFVSTIKERYFAKGAGAFSEPGIPDLLCIKKGRVVMLELKRPMRAAVCSENQHIWHAKWKEQGGEVYVVRSIEDAIDVCDKEAANEAGF